MFYLVKKYVPKVNESLIENKLKMLISQYFTDKGILLKALFFKMLQAISIIIHSPFYLMVN